MCDEYEGINELDDEAREIADEGRRWNARLGAHAGDTENHDDEDGDDDEDDDEGDDGEPRALSWKKFLVKREGVDVKALVREMVEHCRAWKEENDAINKACDEGRMSEFNAINAASDLQRRKSRQYHDWRLRSMGMAKKRLYKTADVYDKMIRLAGGDARPEDMPSEKTADDKYEEE